SGGKRVGAVLEVCCSEDVARNCVTQLEPVNEATWSYAWAAHRKQCHVDGNAFSLKGASDCPVCGKGACTEHRLPCAYCGRHVCTADLSRESRRCATCTRLEAIAPPELPAEVVTAARSVTRRAPKPSRARRLTV